MADNKPINMFWRLVLRALRLRLQRVFIIFAALTVGASIVTAMAAVYFDINTKMSQELRTFGANFYIGSADGGMMNQAELNTILQKLPDGFITAASPYLYGIARSDLEKIVLMGVNFDAMRILAPYWQITGSAINVNFDDRNAMIGKTLAERLHVKVGDSLQLSKNAVACMQTIGRCYPGYGYGDRCYRWIFAENPKPYNSYGNGSAMRVSAAGFAAHSLDEAKLLSKLVTEVTHNHPEGMKGAEAIAVALYLAKTGKDIQEIREYINEHYYTMDFTLDEIRDTYRFNESCQGTVPQALQAFFESTDFEDAIRNAISIGGDSDTVAAICGGVAQAYYGIPTGIRKQALSFLDTKLLGILTSFEEQFMSNL